MRSNTKHTYLRALIVHRLAHDAEHLLGKHERLALALHAEFGFEVAQEVTCEVGGGAVPAGVWSSSSVWCGVV